MRPLDGSPRRTSLRCSARSCRADVAIPCARDISSCSLDSRPSADHPQDKIAELEDQLQTTKRQLQTTKYDLETERRHFHDYSTRMEREAKTLRSKDPLEDRFNSTAQRVSSNHPNTPSDGAAHDSPVDLTFDHAQVFPPIPPQPQPIESLALVAKSLPDKNNIKALIDSGDKVAYENIPEAITKLIRELFDTFLTAKNGKYAGAAWWENIQLVRTYAKGSKASQTLPSCLHFFFCSGGASAWSIMYNGLRACLSCTNKQRPCLAYNRVTKEIVLLPLLEDVRSKGSDTSPDETGYWVRSLANVTLRQPDLRNLWTGGK